MDFEAFSDGESLLHRLDVRIKLLSAILLITVLAVSRSYQPALTGLTIGTVLVITARLDWRSVAKRLLLVNGFVLFLWITLPLSYPGSPLFSIGPLSFSRDGVMLAALITIKANGSVLILMALIATSSIADLGNGLSRLKVPDSLCMLLLFSYRYIFVIHQEYQRLLRAARLRSFQAGTNFHTYRTFGYLFGMTLVKSLHRADRVRQAMILRGFQGRFYSLNISTIGTQEVCFGVLVAALTGSMVSLELIFR